MSHSGSKQEIEIKLSVPSAESGRGRILEAGFQVVVPRVFEANTMYDTPEGFLRQKGFVLRLRRAGNVFTLTFKGSSVPGKYKSREEDEIVVSDYAAAESIVTKMGYGPVFRYEKYRTEFAKPQNGGSITLDETPIGDFLELEGSPEWIDATARALKFHEGEYIIDSYGKLYTIYCRSAGRHPTNMVFGELRPHT